MATFARLLLAVCAVLALAGQARAQGGPTTRITEEPAVSQPPPFSTRGTTVVVPRTRIEIDEGGSRPAPRAPARAKEAKPAPTAAPTPEPAAAPACTHSKILCGDPLRRRKKKDEAKAPAEGRAE